MNNLSKEHYIRHKYNSKQRGIDFELTYEQWLEIWESSGFAHLRGRKKGQYVMARYGDIGSYSINNVCIVPQEKNHTDSLNIKPFTDRTNTKMSEETKSKISQSKKGKVFSDEHKQKLREKRLQYWANKRLTS
jgi:hypothetical protein